MRNQFIRVENFINPMDPNILWYYIPGFNGYEISNTGIVRSMKHYKKYPFGILIKPKEINNIIELFTIAYNDLTYELSDNNNERKVVKRSTLQYLASSNPYSISGYPRSTFITDISSRNQRIYSQQPIIPPIKKENRQVQLYYENDTNINKRSSEIIQPLIFERAENNV